MAATVVAALQQATRVAARGHAGSGRRRGGSVNGFNARAAHPAYPRAIPGPDWLAMQISPSCPAPGGQRGFTLGEVLTTLGVVGLSLSLVVPSFSSVSRSNLRASAINELVATLHVARSEAITRNAPIVICPSADGLTCGRVAWDAGWIRFVDANGDYRADPDETVLGAAPPVAGLRIQTEAFDRAFGYTPSGRVAAPDGGQSGGDFTFCAGESQADAQVLRVSPLGQPVLADRLVNGREPDCSLG